MLCLPISEVRQRAGLTFKEESSNGNATNTIAPLIMKLVLRLFPQAHISSSSFRKSKAGLLIMQISTTKSASWFFTVFYL